MKVGACSDEATPQSSSTGADSQTVSTADNRGAELQTERCCGSNQSVNNVIGTLVIKVVTDTDLLLLPDPL